MYLILLAILGVTLGTKQIRDTPSLITVHNEKIPNTHYSIFSNQTLTLTYDSYPGVFTMDLKKKTTDGKVDQYEVEDYEAFQEDAGYNLNQPGCVAFQRQITTGEALTVPLPSDDSRFFTDIIPVPSQNKTFLVRNDFTVFEVFMTVEEEHVQKIAYPGNHTNFQSYLNVTNQIDFSDNNPFIIIDPETQVVFLFTQFGAVSFKSEQPFTPEFRFEKEDVHQRDRIFDVQYNKLHKAIFVSVGTDGIDIYRVVKGHLQFLKNYHKLELNLEDVNIMDADFNEKGSLLYVLDSQKGFITCDITNIDAPKPTSFNIPIQRAFAFDHFGNTIFFLAQSIYNQDYAVEVFVDFEKDTYFYNRFYQDEMQIFDVIMFDFYTVLVGYDAHKIIFHSLYHGFINNLLEHHTIFTVPELIKVVEYEWNQGQRHHQLVGLGKYEFKTFKVEYVHPIVKCRSTQAYEAMFLLQMNSTMCKTKEQKNDNSQFASCNIHHIFTLQVDEVFISTQSKIWVIVGVVFTFVIMFALALTLYLCWQKWGGQLTYLGSQIIELKKQEKYDVQENNNIQGKEDEA